MIGLLIRMLLYLYALSYLPSVEYIGCSSYFHAMDRKVQ